MKKSVTIFLFILSISTMAQSNFSVEYYPPYTNRIWDIEEFTDSSYILAGGSNGFAVWEVSSNIGTTKWVKKYNVTALMSWLYGVEKTLDGGLLLTGRCYTGLSGGDDILLIRTDSVGNMLWSKVYGENNDDMIYDAIQLPDSSFIVCGAYTLPSATYTSASLMRLDANGNIIWAKNVETGGFDKLYKLVLTSDNNILASGILGGKSHIIKIDLNGNTIWERSISIYGSGVAQGLVETPDKGVFVVTQASWIGFGSSSGISDLVIFKLDSLGNMEWNKFYGNRGREFSEHALLDKKDSTIIAVFDEDLVNDGTSMYGLVKFDLNGNYIWGKAFGGVSSDYPRVIKQDQEGNLIFSGSATSFTGSYLEKTDNNGNGSGCFEGVMTFDTTGVWPTINVDTSSNYNFISPISLTHTIVVDTVIVSDTIYCYNCDSSIANFGDSVNNNQVVFSDSSINSTEYFWDFGDGNTSALKNPVHTYSSSNIFNVCLTTKNSCDENSICKQINVIINNISEKILLSDVLLYPNPNNGQFTLSLKDTNTQINQLEIFNNLGQIVYSKNINSTEITINLQQPKGIYFVKIITENGVIAKKIIINN